MNASPAQLYPYHHTCAMKSEEHIVGRPCPTKPKHTAHTHVNCPLNVVAAVSGGASRGPERGERPPIVDSQASLPLISINQGKLAVYCYLRAPHRAVQLEEKWRKGRRPARFCDDQPGMESDGRERAQQHTVGAQPLPPGPASAAGWVTV
jgi:hypothetical protein